MRRGVSELGAGILLHLNRAQAALPADVNPPRLRIGRRTAVDVDTPRRAGCVPGALVPTRCRAVRRRSRYEVRAHATLLRELERRIFDRRRVVDEVGFDETLLRIGPWPRWDGLRLGRPLAGDLTL